MPIDDALAQLGPSIIVPKIEETSSSGSYIVLPGNDYHEELLISKEKKHFGKNWSGTPASDSIAWRLRISAASILFQLT